VQRVRGVGRGTRHSIVILACLAATGLLASCGASNAATHSSSGGAVTYVSVQPFSGSSAFIGTIATAGLYPAVAEINAAGGILGRKVKLSLVDTKGDPADALTAVAAFTATTSNILGVQGPSTTEAPTIVPVLNKHKITMMSVAGNALFDHNPYQYYWRTAPPDPANGIAMALYAKSRGWTRAALVFGADSSSQGDLPGVLAGAKALGLQIVATANLTPQQPSYSGEVARVISARPQVIFTESDPTTASTFFSELVQQQSEPIYVVATSAAASGTYLTPVERAVGASRLAQFWRTVSFQSAPPNKATALFSHWLLKSGKQVSNPKQWLGNFYAGDNYDGLILVALAAVASGHASGPALNHYIMDVANPGLGKFPVYSYAAGVKLLKEHKRIEYIGAGGPFRFDRYHNSYGNQLVQQYLDGRYVTTQTITEAQISAVK
jgi:ABC-type branched-subunit amino acid transport system substrate-binding protein